MLLSDDTISITTRRYIATDAAIALLAETWPLCFAMYEVRRRPLKIGIRDDILAALNGAVTVDELSAALRRYTGNRHYLRALAFPAGAARVDLDGNPCGEVTKEQAAGAAALLASYAAKRRQRMAAEALAPAAAVGAPTPTTVAPSPVPALELPSPQPAGPKRLGLADLREAARLRREREAAAA